MNLLFIDPDGGLVSSVAGELSRRRHSVIVASTAQDGIDHLGHIAVDAVFSPLYLPDGSGVAFLQRAHTVAKEVYRVAILDGESPADAVRAAVNQGRAHHVLTASELVARLPDWLASIDNRRQGRLAWKATLRSAEEWAKCLEVRVAEANQTADQALEEMLIALVSALDLRENESAHHSRRVALACLLFAIELGVDPETYPEVYHGALLHDVGKIGIRDGVLLKPGRLTADERRHIETHVDIGVQLIAGVSSLHAAMDIPRYHHEHFDGLGYAQGLVGEQIPPAARMFALVDVYDALRSHRPYKGAMSHEDSIAILRDESGTHFDPEMVNVFCEIGLEKWEAVSKAAHDVRSIGTAMLTCERIRAGELTALLA